MTDGALPSFVARHAFGGRGTPSQIGEQRRKPTVHPEATTEPRSQVKFAADPACFPNFRKDDELVGPRNWAAQPRPSSINCFARHAAREKRH